MGFARTPRQQQQPYTHENTASAAPELDSFSAYGNGAAPVSPFIDETPCLDAAAAQCSVSSTESASDWTLDEGGEGEATTNASGLPRTKAAALQRQSEGARKIDQLVRTALAQTTPEGEDDASRLVLLKNSAEWVEQGLVTIRALAPTHDSARRTTEGKTAYFDQRLAYNEGGSDYNEHNQTDSNGVLVQNDDVAAHCDRPDNAIVFFDPAAAGEADLANTLIHEMQHFCDPGPKEVFEPDIPDSTKYNQAEPWVYSQYASEYRARIVDPIEAKRFGNPDEAAKTKLSLTATRNPRNPEVANGRLPPTASIQTAFWNEQQACIFADMVRDPSISSWRDYATHDWLATYGYFPHFFVLDESFRDYVENLGEEGPHGIPLVGGNMVNSVRIDALTQSIVSGAVGIAIQTAARALDEVDRAFLADETRSSAFWSAVRCALSERPLVLRMLEAEVAGKSAVPDPERELYTVVRGDTLGLIAERVLGDRARYREILALNPSIDPEHLAVGSRLVMP